MSGEVRGVVPPVPTFLRVDGSLDRQAQARTVDRLVLAGVDGLLVLGSAGEGPVLQDDLAAEVVSVSVAAAGGRLPVVTCCAGQTTKVTLQRIDQAAEAGASAVLLLPPFYYPLSQRQLRAFVNQVVARASLPLILYHIPERTGHGFSVETLAGLAARPKVVGVKDSAKDLAYHYRLLREVAGASFAVFQGAAPLVLASAVTGSKDSMCPVTALVPEWELALRSALSRGDVTTAAEFGKRISQMASLFAVGDGPMPASFKAVASLLGLGPSTPHDSFACLEPAEVARLVKGLRDIGFGSLDEAAVATAAPREGTAP